MNCTNKEAVQMLQPHFSRKPCTGPMELFAGRHRRFHFLNGFSENFQLSRFHGLLCGPPPQEGPHIASHSVCPSVRPSLPVITYFRTSATCFRQPCGRAVSFVLFTCQGRIQYGDLSRTSLFTLHLNRFSYSAKYSYSVYISYIMSCFLVCYLCVLCACVRVLLAT